MAGKFFNGRYTADLAGQEKMAFPLGMRSNHWWRAAKWGKVFTAMPRMLRQIKTRHAELPSWETWWGRTLLVLRHWHSFEELHSFATASPPPHATAWRDFNRRIGNDGTVGGRHESHSPGRPRPRRGRLRQHAHLRPGSSHPPRPQRAWQAASQGCLLHGTNNT